MTLPLRHRIAETIEHLTPDRQTETILQVLVQDGAINLPTAMASLEVGEYLLLPACRNNTFHQAKISARRILRDDEAKWSYRSTPQGVMVAREAANWNPAATEARAGLQARIMAAMAVGDSQIMPGMFDTHKGLRGKATARALTNEPDAEWMARTTNKGVRVTRIR